MFFGSQCVFECVGVDVCMYLCVCMNKVCCGACVRVRVCVCVCVWGGVWACVCVCVCGCVCVYLCMCRGNVRTSGCVGVLCFVDTFPVICYTQSSSVLSSHLSVSLPILLSLSLSLSSSLPPCSPPHSFTLPFFLLSLSFSL